MVDQFINVNVYILIDIEKSKAAKSALAHVGTEPWFELPQSAKAYAKIRPTDFPHKTQKITLQ